MANQSLAAVVHELGPGFAARAAAHDESGEFVAENYRALRERKLMSAGVPSDLGGGGASHAELCEMIRALAQYCPSTALAFAMHTHVVAAATWRHLHGQPGKALLELVAAAERVLVSTGAQDWVDSSGLAERVEGGFKVSARKRFASGSPFADIAVTSAPAELPGEGSVVLHFPVKLDAPGVSLESDWNTLGMRATGSHTIRLDGVFVPDSTIASKRPRGQWHPSLNVVMTVACPIFMSAYVGLAEHGAALARESAAARTASPHTPYQIGDLQNELLSAQLALDEMIRNARNYDFAPEIERANRALQCRTLTGNAVRRVLEHAVEISGGSAFYKKSTLERLWRDAQGAQFHPLPERQQTYFTGRVCLGLTP